MPGIPRTSGRRSGRGLLGWEAFTEQARAVRPGLAAQWCLGPGEPAAGFQKKRTAALERQLGLVAHYRCHEHTRLPPDRWPGARLRRPGPAMNHITGSTALWYASRATGIVALVLLTAVVLLGILVSRQGRLPGLPRFAGTALHRSVSMLAVCFLVVHVATAIADPYVSIRALAAVIPFTSAYEPFWLGLGAVAADLIIALIGTSLLRARIGRRVWRGVHWLAYAAWPVALAHSLGASTDLRHGGLLDLAVGCCLVVAAAVAWRLAGAARSAPVAHRAAAVLAGSGQAARQRPRRDRPGHGQPDYNRPGYRRPDYERPQHDRPKAGIR